MDLALSQSLENLAFNTRALRKKRGFSQVKLAETSKIALGTIFNIERQLSSPTWGTIELVAAALGVHAYELMLPPSMPGKKSRRKTA
jgi:transcriptional regulator with XRE-family HTH domain